MSKKRMFLVVFLLIFNVTACVSAKKAELREVPRITKDQLRANLENDSYVIIDVRIPKDYDSSDLKIRGAIRENPMDVSFWSPYPKDKTIVLYCA
jgi:rhodanese-related sulfurtransferase